MTSHCHHCDFLYHCNEWLGMECKLCVSLTEMTDSLLYRIHLKFCKMLILRDRIIVLKSQENQSESFLGRRKKHQEPKSWKFKD